MRYLLLALILLSSCNNGSSSSRTYVISQAHETAAETEVTAEPPVD